MEKEGEPRRLELKIIKSSDNFYAEFELNEMGAVFCEGDKAYHLGDRVFFPRGDYYIEYKKYG